VTARKLLRLQSSRWVFFVKGASHESAARAVMLICAQKLNRLLCLFALAIPASGQLDSGQLRVKFGTPPNREIFPVPPAFDLVVD
jgi:hypothetical protein